MTTKAPLVLCYHAVRDLSDDPVLAQYGVARDAFAAQMDSLATRGFRFLTPDDLVAVLGGATPPSPRSVLVTFDDCYEELADVASDVLEPRGIRAIAFAVTGMPSGTNEWDQVIGARRLRLLDAGGLRRAALHGIEIGCHSRSHRSMPRLSDIELDEETKGAADDLAALGVQRPRFFAFPHGQHDGRVRAAVRRAGFAAAFGLYPTRVRAGSDRFAVPRVEILARDAGRRFVMKTEWPAVERLRGMFVNRLAVPAMAVGNAVRAKLSRAGGGGQGS